MTHPEVVPSAPFVQQHQFTPPCPEEATPSPDAVAPPGEAPDARDVRKLRRAEEDLSLYSAILGRRPTVAPDVAVDDEAERKRFQIALHLNIPTRLPLRSLSSLVPWRGRDGSGSATRASGSSRIKMLRLPKPGADGDEAAPKASVSTWFRHVSDRARKCVDDVLMRLAS